MNHNLYVKCKSIKLLEDKIGENLGDHGFGKLLDITEKVWFIKKNYIWVSLKFKFLSAKDSVKKMERQSIDWKEIATKQVSDKAHISKTYKDY